MIYIRYDRTNLPDLAAFIRFEPPSTGHIYDANGHILIELGRERHEIIEYQDIPGVLRQAILSAEDENFFSHSGVDFSVFPRLLSKTNVHALIGRGGSDRVNAPDRASVFPQGGSTITQQLVRGEDATQGCSEELVRVFTRICEPPAKHRPAIYRSKQESGRLVFANE